MVLTKFRRFDNRNSSSSMLFIMLLSCYLAIKKFIFNNRAPWKIMYIGCFKVKCIDIQKSLWDFEFALIILKLWRVVRISFNFRNFLLNWICPWTQECAPGLENFAYLISLSLTIGVRHFIDWKSNNINLSTHLIT